MANRLPVTNWFIVSIWTIVQKNHERRTRYYTSGTLRAIIRSTGLSLEQFLASGGQEEPHDDNV